MSEKRFTLEKRPFIVIVDNATSKEYDDANSFVDLLNEQQATIEQLKKDKAILKERLREQGMRLDKLLGNCR